MNVRLVGKLIVLVIVCISPKISFAGCDESQLQQNKMRQNLENYADYLRKKPRDSLSKFELSTVDSKRSYERLETAMAVCPAAAKTYGVSNIWYSFTGDLYVLPYELSVPEANRISDEICSRKEKSKKLTMYFVDRLSVLKMNSLNDIEKLGDLQKGYLRVCQD